MSKTVVTSDKVDLRRGIDHIGVSVCAVIYDEGGRILLMKRGKGARDEHGRWDICGGALEFGESIDEAVRREVKEELCAEPTDIEFVGIYDAHRVHTDGSPTHWVALLHAVRVDPAKVKIGEPHKIDQIGWFFSHELPSPRHSQFDKNYQQALARGIVK
jgi:ADP-ribose pyrophosphatase YjhB (NUDIX family)